MPVYGNYTFNRTLYEFVETVCSLTRMDRDSIPALLGTTLSLGKTEFCRIVNDFQQSLVMENPVLQQKAASISLTTGTVSYAIPADLLGGDIVNIELNTPDDLPWKGQRLDYVLPWWKTLQPSADRFSNQPAIVPYPTYWTYDLDRTEIVFQNFWYTNFTVDVYYRYAPDYFVAADYDDAASAKRFAIPDLYLTNTLAKMVARELFARNGSTEREEQMRLAVEGNGVSSNGSRLAMSEELSQSITNLPYSIVRHDSMRHTGGMSPILGGSMRRLPRGYSPRNGY